MTSTGGGTSAPSTQAVTAAGAGAVLLVSRKVPADLAVHLPSQTPVGLGHPGRSGRGGRVGRVGSRPRAWVVSHAADWGGRRTRVEKHQRDAAALEVAGFEPRPLDLGEFDGRRDADRTLLTSLASSADLVWVGGGNTFCLLDALRFSGFGDLLGPLVAGGLSYAGESAGAVALAGLLDQVDTVDDPAASSRYRGSSSAVGATSGAGRAGRATSPGGGVEFRGLGLLPFLPWPHWRPTPAPNAGAGPGHLNGHLSGELPGDGVVGRWVPSPAGVPMWRLRDGEYLLLEQTGPSRPSDRTGDRTGDRVGGRVWDASPVLVDTVDRGELAATLF